MPSCRIAHNDPIAILSALGLLGTRISATTELYFKEYDPATGVVRSDGGAIKIAISAGYITPDGWQASQGAVATTGFLVQAITTDGGDSPLTVTLSATPPAVP